jgi:GNAT superfamily N-acetyltransferase
MSSGPQLSIRAADQNDVASLVGAYDWLFEPPIGVPPTWNPTAAEDRLRRLLAAQTGTAFLAVVSDELVGFCTVYLDLESVRFGQRAWVNDMAVHPQQRSQGVGHHLLDAARGWARDNGATVIQLDSGPARAEAHRFYRHEQPTFEATCFGWRL